MSDGMYWIYVVRVNEDAYEQFKELVAELVDASTEEAGTLSYEFSTSDGGRTVHIFEHYRDSAAVVSHVQQTFARFADRFNAMAHTTSVTVYGNPDAAARKLIDEWGAVYMTPFDGFVHQG